MDETKSKDENKTVSFVEPLSNYSTNSTNNIRTPINTDRLVSLVTLDSCSSSSNNSSDAESSSLASSSHSNIDLIIDAGSGGDRAAAATLANLATTETRTSMAADAAATAATLKMDQWPSCKSPSPLPSALKTSALFKRRNSNCSIYGTPRRQSSFFGGNSTVAAAAATTAPSSTPPPPPPSSPPPPLPLSADCASTPMLPVFDELETINNTHDTSETLDECVCSECGAYIGYVSIRNRLASVSGAEFGAVLCAVCMQKHWQEEVNELLKFKSSLESCVRDLRRYLSMI